MEIGPRRTLGNVLLATDFSDGARLALERAIRLPLGLGASLDLVHVLTEGIDEVGAQRVEAGEKRRMEELRESVQRAREGAGNKDRDVFVSTARGKPFVFIIKRARRGRAELIVVGRHGERTFRDLLIGTTAERVIRKGDVSVLVVSKPPEEHYRKPLVAVDMSDSSRLAVELSLRVCGPALDIVDVVHVVERAEDELRARAELSEFLSKVSGDVRWNVILQTGDPRQVILDLARERESDLVALGTKGRTGLAHILVGSIAEGVVRSAPCDVLVARLPRADFRMP